MCVWETLGTSSLIKTGDYSVLFQVTVLDQLSLFTCSQLRMEVSPAVGERKGQLSGVCPQHHPECLAVPGPSERGMESLGKVGGIGLQQEGTVVLRGSREKDKEGVGAGGLVNLTAEGRESSRLLR